MYTFYFDAKKFLRKESESEKGWKGKNAESDTSNQGKRNEIEHECVRGRKQGIGQQRIGQMGV